MTNDAGTLFVACTIEHRSRIVFFEPRGERDTACAAPVASGFVGPNHPCQVFYGVES